MPLSRVLPFSLLAAYALCCLFLWTQDTWRPEWDSAIYLQTARSLAAGEGYQYLGRPFFLRPPGLPWLLSHTSTSVLPDARSVNRLIMLFAALSAFAVYLALRQAIAPPAALAIALLSGTSPLIVSRFNWVHSEFPFLAFLYFGLSAARAAIDSPRRGPVLHFAAGILLAIAYYFRTTAVILVPGFLLVGLIPRAGSRPLHAWIAPALVILLAIPWLRYESRARALSEIPPDQTLLLDYGTALFREEPGDPSSPHLSFRGWARRFDSNGRMLLREAGEALIGRGGAAAGAALSSVAALGFLAAVRRRPTILEWFAAAYIAVLLSYFTYATRLVTPLVPMLYYYVFRFVDAVLSRVREHLRFRRAANLVPAVLAAILLLLNATEFHRRLECPRIREGGKEVDLAAMWSRDYEAAAWVRDHTPSDAVLLCFNAPVLSVLSGRTAYTYRFPRGRDLLEKYDPDLVLFDCPHPAAARLERTVAGRAAERLILPSRTPGTEIRAYRMPRGEHPR